MPDFSKKYIQRSLIFSGRRKSKVWNLFTKKDNFVATCNICQKDYSYKSAVSNLFKHYQKKHCKQIEDDTTDCSDGDWSDNR